MLVLVRGERAYVVMWYPRRWTFSPAPVGRYVCSPPDCMAAFNCLDGAVLRTLSDGGGEGEARRGPQPGQDLQLSRQTDTEER